MRWSYYIFSILVIFHIHALSHPVPGSLFDDSQYSTLSKRGRRRGSKVPSFQSPIRTYQIRGSNARKDAIQNAAPHYGNSAKDKEKIKKEFATQQADHVLELQAVTKHMNNHLTTAAAVPGADAAKCFAKVKEAINQKNNLVMIPGTVNGQKGRVTNALLNGKPHPGFSAESKAHILKYQKHMLDVGSSVDEILRTEECGHMPPGVRDHAKQMIAEAKKH